MALQVYSPRRSRVLSAAVRAASALVVASVLRVAADGSGGAPLSAQVGPVSAPAADTVVSEQAARDALSQARSAQSRFERQRRQFSPAERGGWVGTSCDEHVGRICLRYDEGGDWWPQPEDRRIQAARVELLETLARSATAIPRDRWVFGQRVLYLAEGGFLDDAEALARSCDDPAGARWCGLLVGLVLHVGGRFVESEASFRSALGAMDDVERSRWMDPEPLLDPDGKGYLDDLGDEDTPRRNAALDLLWRIADPLYLVDGNDRLTEHWSRLTVARLRDRTTNPYALSWGDDLEEVLVRYGWEVGWDRVTDVYGSTGTGMVGHHHPESRGYLPPGSLLRSPITAARRDWPLSRARPQEGYAPPYAPVVVPAEAELLRFPRADRVVLVAAVAEPTDTTHHSKHSHPRFAPAEAPPTEAAQTGLFLIPLDGGEGLGVRASGAVGDPLMLEAPAGSYLASAEVWFPARGFAGRVRQGIDAPRLPPNQPTLSDLMLLERLLPDSVRLEDAVHAMRRPGPVRSRESLAVGWELNGLSLRGEPLAYRLSVSRGSTGFFRRVGELLRISSPEEPLRLGWEEVGPTGPGPSFRTLALELPELDDGEYVLRLEVSFANGPPIASERTLVVSRP